MHHLAHDAVTAHVDAGDARQKHDLVYIRQAIVLQFVKAWIKPFANTMKKARVMLCQQNMFMIWA